jgi:hypothetical protein
VAVALVALLLFLGILGRGQGGHGEFVRYPVVAHRPDDKVGTAPRSFRTGRVALADADAVGVVGTVLFVVLATTAAEASLALERNVRDRSGRCHEFDKLHCCWYRILYPVGLDGDNKEASKQEQR